MESLTEFPSLFSPSLAHFCPLWKGDKNRSPAYLIGYLSNSHTIRFAKVLRNFESLWRSKVQFTLSKEPWETLHIWIDHSMSALQGGYHHHFQVPDKENRAKEVKCPSQVYKIICAGAEIRNRVSLTPNPLFFPQSPLFPWSLGVTIPVSGTRLPAVPFETRSWLMVCQWGRVIFPVSMSSFVKRMY